MMNSDRVMLCRTDGAMAQVSVCVCAGATLCEVQAALAQAGEDAFLAYTGLGAAG